MDFIAHSCFLYGDYTDILVKVKESEGKWFVTLGLLAYDQKSLLFRKSCQTYKVYFKTQKDIPLFLFYI